MKGSRHSRSEAFISELPKNPIPQNLFEVVNDPLIIITTNKETFFKQNPQNVFFVLYCIVMNLDLNFHNSVLPKSQ